MIRLISSRRVLVNGTRFLPPCSRTTPALHRSFWGKSDNDDNNNNNDDKTNESTETTKESSSTATVVPSSTGANLVPFGEPAPRMPHSLALPIVSRPLYPGLLTSITLSDEPTISAIEELHKKDSENAYISCFLRAKDSTGVSEGGAILPVSYTHLTLPTIYSV